MTFLPDSDRNYLASKGLIFDEVQDGSQKAIIIKKWALPTGKYDATEVEVLVLFRPGYPDVGPDMFYMIPWVKLTSGNKYPNAADQPHQFLGKNWQRWSRHNDEWRPGIDGIWTMIKRIECAIEEAK